MSRERQEWEERYAARSVRSHGCDEPPSEFLIAHADSIRGRVVDVAAGSGRNALFLARRGCTVEALDLSMTGLSVARRRAVAEGLAVHAVQVDLETFPLPPDRFDAAINIRYLQRTLFPTLQRAVKPGGIILFETFLIDQQTIGHPHNPDFLLQRGELRAAFAQMELLLYEEGLFSTPTPAYLARMIARRRIED